MSTEKIVIHKGYTPWMAKENAAIVKGEKVLEWKGTPIPEEVIYKGVRLVMAGPPLDATKVKK